jgi:hypothetical protein
LANRETVWATNDTSATAFTRDGIENLRQLVVEHRKLSAAHE